MKRKKKFTRKFLEMILREEIRIESDNLVITGMVINFF